MKETLGYAKVNYKEKKTVFTSKAKLFSGFSIFSLQSHSLVLWKGPGSRFLWDSDEIWGKNSS